MPQPSPAVPPRTLQTIRVLDAVDHLDRPLGALRAIEALTECYKADAEHELPSLRRPDLANLIALVADDLEQVQGRARQAVDAVLDEQPLSQPVVSKATKGAKA